MDESNMSAKDFAKVLSEKINSLNDTINIINIYLADQKVTVVEGQIVLATLLSESIAQEVVEEELPMGEYIAAMNGLLRMLVECSVEGRRKGEPQDSC